MANSLRIFIAVELSKEIHENLARIMLELGKYSTNDIRWVKSENIHLTLKFIGDTPQSRLSSLSSTIESICADQPCFALTSEETGVFPNLRQPRVLWAGITAPDGLLELQKRIDAELLPLGVAVERRPFSPHLTLGRVSDSANPDSLARIIKELSAYSGYVFGSVTVRQVTLFQSTLTHGGSIYCALKRFSLKSQG